MGQDIVSYTWCSRLLLGCALHSLAVYEVHLIDANVWPSQAFHFVLIREVPTNFAVLSTEASSDVQTKPTMSTGHCGTVVGINDAPGAAIYSGFPDRLSFEVVESQERGIQSVVNGMYISGRRVTCARIRPTSRSDRTQCTDTRTRRTRHPMTHAPVSAIERVTASSATFPFVS